MNGEQVLHKYCCERCEAHIGDVTPAGLIMGSGRLIKAVTILCVKCGRSNRWYPAAAKASYVPSTQVNHEEQIAAIIQQSMSQNDEKRLLAAKESRSLKRDADIDAAEEEADNRFYDALANNKQVKKRA
jgi:hypothetical protein